MSRKKTPRNPVPEALQAGALVGGVFLSLLGALRAVMRLNLLPRGEVVVLLPLAILVVLAPLIVGVKFGFRDNTPPALKAYRHALPWARSPTEELLGAVLGGAFWAALGVGLASLLERVLPAPGLAHVVIALFGPALAAGAAWAIHGASWSRSSAFFVVLFIDLVLASPMLLLGPRGPFGGASGLGVLAQENFEAASLHRESAVLPARARALAIRACADGHARSCFLASYTSPTRDNPAEVDDLVRRGCDLTTSSFAPCVRYIGESFSSSAAVCSVETRCTGGHGVECSAGLLGCKRALAPGLSPACARREAAGWREVWCSLPLP